MHDLTKIYPDLETESDTGHDTKLINISMLLFIIYAVAITNRG